MECHKKSIKQLNFFYVRIRQIARQAEGDKSDLHCDPWRTVDRGQTGPRNHSLCTPAR